MKKAFSVFIIITIIMSVFVTNVFAIVPIVTGEEKVRFSGTTMEEMKFSKTNVLTFTPTKYDSSFTNGVAVTGIGGKAADDESVQVFSRIKTASNENFRIQFNLNGLTGKGNIIPGTTGNQWYHQDTILEFKIIPNEYVTKIEITDKGNTFASITGLSTASWNHVRIVIDSENYTSYTFVNGLLHTINDGLSVGSDGKNCQNLRIFGYTTEQDGVEKDADVWFYIDDVAFSQTTVSFAEVHGNVMCTGTAKYGSNKFTTGTLNVKAYSEADANLYIAQYDANGKLVDLDVSETTTGTITIDYQPADTEGKVKIFLWDTEHKPISEAKVLEYQEVSEQPILHK